jgi:excisionase family DNA binding protein
MSQAAPEPSAVTPIQSAHEPTLARGATPGQSGAEPRLPVESRAGSPAPLLTVEDVAERLGVRKEWVWAQARAGRIPHVRLGRYCRFRAETLEAWLLAQERQGEG